MDIKTRHLLKTINYQLEQKGINVRNKKPNLDEEFFIPYEEITNEKGKFKGSNAKYLTATIVLLVLSIISFLANLPQIDDSITMFILFFIPTVIVFCLYYFNKMAFVYVKLSDKKNLVFYYNKKSLHEVEEFIRNLFDKRNEFLKARYAIVEEGFPKEELLSRYRWLLNQSVITDSEYNKLVSTVNTDESINKSQMGFRI